MQRAERLAQESAEQSQRIMIVTAIFFLAAICGVMPWWSLVLPAAIGAGAIWVTNKSYDMALSALSDVSEAVKEQAETELASLDNKED